MFDIQVAFDAIDRYVRQQRDADQIPGLSLAIVDRDETLRTSSYGYANLGTEELVTSQHFFLLGSIGKAFTAVVILQLQEEGRIDLHAPVETYLPWFNVQTAYQPITLHHLLTPHCWHR